MTNREHLTLIHTYSRAEAIAAGDLVDVENLNPGLAREAGFKVPVALTRAAWLDCVHWDETIEASKSRPTGQDSTGRLWDLLNMARISARGGQLDRVAVTLLRVPATGPNHHPDVTMLTLHIGPGDQGEPVVTLMLPGED